jgi:hypothetical protein
VFASARRVSPRPGSNGQNPRPVIVNPGGGDAATATHDLWTTTSQDFTPPLLVPVGTGNQATPFLAPGRQAPFFAPRTAEEGLTNNSKLIVAVVLSEQESGLNTARVVATATPNPNPTAEATEGPIVSPPDDPFTGLSATVRIRSSEPTFTNFITRPNEGVAVNVSVEQSPPYITDDIRLDVYDNGPPSQGGNERQANAIRGDGIYYAQASIDLADALEGQGVGDFMIDLLVTDRANNSLLYDKVYGFSTEAFRKRANMLFVSDYTSGQNFPATLLGADAGGRTSPFAAGVGRGLPPVESYHLSEPRRLGARSSAAFV